MKKHGMFRRLAAAAAAVCMMLAIALPVLAEESAEQDYIVKVEYGSKSTFYFTEANAGQDLGKGLTYDKDARLLSTDQKLENDTVITVASGKGPVDVKLSGAVTMKLTVTNARNVTLESVGTGAVASIFTLNNCIGKLKITCRGNEGAGTMQEAVARLVVNDSIEEVEIDSDGLVASDSITIENCSGKVVLRSNKSSVLMTEDLNIKAGSIEIACNAAKAFDSNSNTKHMLTSTNGDVKLSNASGSMMSDGKMTIQSAGDVVIEGSSTGALVRDIGITCTNGGDVTLTNQNGPVAKKQYSTGALTVTGAKDVTLTGSGAVLAGDGTSTISNSGTVVLQSTSGANVVAGDLAYTPASDSVGYTVKAGASPAEAVQIAAVDADGAASTYTVPDAGKTAAYLAMEPAVDYGVTVNGKKVTSVNAGDVLKNGTVQFDPDVSPRLLTGTGSIDNQDVSVVVGANAGKVDVHLTGTTGPAVFGGLTVTGAHDVSVTTASANSPVIAGSTKISASGKVTVANKNYIAVAGKLTVNGAAGVEVTGGGTSPAITSGAELNDINGNVMIENTGGSAVASGLTAKNVQQVTVTGKGSSPVISGNTTVTNAQGKVTITGEEGIAVAGMLKVEGAAGVEAATGSTDPAVTGGAELTNIKGDVLISNPNGQALAGALKVAGAGDVTVKGGGSSPAMTAGASIACTGRVTLETTSELQAVNGLLIYQNTASGTAYTVKARDAKGTRLLDSTDEDGTPLSPFTLVMPGSDEDNRVLYQYLCITPENWQDPDPEMPADTGSASGDAGGAAAAVLVGSAAVWGGYQIATRVVLHKLLPEGAAIPANRGQLALLVWNTAGRPEPVGAPAFADVADADMAKAAQWCAEQGLLEARSENTFKPNGWVTKFKVIRVWRAAFPNQ